MHEVELVYIPVDQGDASDVSYGVRAHWDFLFRPERHWRNLLAGTGGSLRYNLERTVNTVLADVCLYLDEKGLPKNGDGITNPAHVRLHRIGNMCQRTM